MAGGNKQRYFVTKEDFSSLIISTEAVLLYCIIDAEEKRDVAVIDNPNAFNQTRVENENEIVVIKIRGVLVELLLKINPQFCVPFLTTDK